MFLKEKQRLLELLSVENRWCRDAEARDCDGNAVAFHDARAAAWDLTGAVCCLFGWSRASQLFPQLARHIAGPPRARYRPRAAPEIDALAALQNFNDSQDTTYAVLLEKLRSMPVWRGSAAMAAHSRCVSS